MDKVVSALYKPLPSKKLNQRGENGATDLHPMASDFFFEFKKMCISVRIQNELSFDRREKSAHIADASRESPIGPSLRSLAHSSETSHARCSLHRSRTELSGTEEVFAVASGYACPEYHDLVRTQMTA